MKETIHTDVIVIGAGAAGLMCAWQVAKRGKRVWLIDHNKNPGDKIRISGGGRCNFTNLHCSPANFISENPRFCISALKRFTQHDFIAMVETHQIAYHEKTLGQLFCDGSSKQIIAMLVEGCVNAGVTLALSCPVRALEHRDGLFAVTLDEQIVTAAALVVATGGLSIPKMGATGFAYDVAHQFGLSMIEPRPALVPLTYDPEMLADYKPLAGIACPARVTKGRISFDEALLHTHRGLSGPAILQISSYALPGESVAIDLLPGQDIAEQLRQAREASPKMECITLLSQLLPKRLAQHHAERLGVSGKLSELSNKKIAALGSALHQWSFTIDGTEGYAKAEVTAGGVDTRALSSKTMQVNHVPGLYMIGEAVDVTGHLGGFNFQWAWSSGYVAGHAV